MTVDVVARAGAGLPRRGAGAAPRRPQARAAGGARLRRAGRVRRSWRGWRSTRACRRRRPPTRSGPGKPLALVWSLRGAPYVHRRDDLDAVAAALYPMSEQDAGGRLNETGPAVERAGIAAVEQYELAVRGDARGRHEVDGQGRGQHGGDEEAAAGDAPRRAAAAGRATSRTPRCASSFLPAGLELEPDTAPPVLRRRPKAKLPKRSTAPRCAGWCSPTCTLLGPAIAGRRRRLPRRAPGRPRGRLARVGPDRGAGRQGEADVPARRRSEALRVAARAGRGAPARPVRPVPAGARPDRAGAGQGGAQDAVAGARRGRAPSSSTARSPGRGGPRVRRQADRHRRAVRRAARAGVGAGRGRGRTGRRRPRRPDACAVDAPDR